MKMNLKLVIAAMIINLVKAKDNMKETMKRKCDTSVSDFNRIVETDTFVDKSILIKTIFEKESVILITAPRRFGKSTNLNMVKRFLEINVNAKGEEQKDASKTKNYKLFKNNNLKIADDETFFNKHFGKHPVIFIDYKPLSAITNFNSMLDSFKIILRKTFLQHEYLVHLKRLWTNSLSLNKFKKYIDAELNENLTPLDIKQGFTYLSEILCKHFKKTVFVLLDEYDAYIDSMIFKNNADMDDIVTFVQGVNNGLLTSNDYLDRAVLTGILRVTGTGLSAPGSNIKDYSFLRNHLFSGYYGITEDELEEMLIKLITNQTELAITKRAIIDYYRGYTVIKQNIKLYSTWSIINFMENNQEAISYWCKPEYVQSFIPIFSLEEIQTKIEDLLSGKTIVLDITTPLAKHDILSLNSLLNLNYANQQLVLSFFHFLFELGYLSIQDSHSVDQSSIYAVIPNLEIKLEFAHTLRQVYIKQYDISLTNINALNKVINSVCGETANHKLFIDVHKHLSDLYGQSCYHPKSENNFRSILLVSLMSKFHSAQSEIYNAVPPGYMDILLRNDKGVYFIIEIKFSPSTDKTYRDQMALNGHKEIILKGYINYLGAFSRNKIVYLGISYSSDKNISIGYSYFLKGSDNLSSTKII